MSSGWTWIRSQYQPPRDSPAAFATQPYEQLAAVYRQAGQDTQARKVAIARRADLRRYGNLNPYRKVGNWLLDKTIKYGYQAWRAGVGLAVVFVVFGCLSVLAQHHHLIVPVGDTAGLHPVPSATDAPAATRASTRSATPSIRSSRSSTSTRPTTGARTGTPRGAGPGSPAPGSRPGSAGHWRPSSSPATPGWYVRIDTSASQAHP